MSSDHRDLHGLTHSFPTRRSSDRPELPTARAEAATQAPGRLRRARQKMRDEQEVPAPAVPADDPARLAREEERRRHSRRLRLRRLLLVLAPLVVAAAAGYVYLTSGRFVDRKSTRLNSSP